MYIMYTMKTYCPEEHTNMIKNYKEDPYIH